MRALAFIIFVTFFSCKTDLEKQVDRSKLTLKEKAERVEIIRDFL